MCAEEAARTPKVGLQEQSYVISPLQAGVSSDFYFSCGLCHSSQNHVHKGAILSYVNYLMDPWWTLSIRLLLLLLKININTWTLKNPNLTVLLYWSFIDYFTHSWAFSSLTWTSSREWMSQLYDELNKQLNSKCWAWNFQVFTVPGFCSSGSISSLNSTITAFAFESRFTVSLFFHQTITFFFSFSSLRFM